MSRVTRIPPMSCDTFAVLPPFTHGNCVIFGKNSDRPCEEVQEVVYVPATDHPQPSMVNCTYIEIKQVPHTYAVVLSKPVWMWGAEMGANEHSVCIGNEAVWTILNSEADYKKKLLGMDLLRLGLERGKTALEALHVITSLLSEHGMGGNCSHYISDFVYHNSFLIADPSEVWILECAGKLWAAERIKEGTRNISNALTIGTNIDLKSIDLERISVEKGLWRPQANKPFDFKVLFDEKDSNDNSRYVAGKLLLTNYTENKDFKATDMFKILRDKPSGICMSSGHFLTTASQVSVLHKPESGLPSCHWFTATPDPAQAVFKPFVFGEDIRFPDAVMAIVDRASSREIVRSNAMHELYRLYVVVKTGKNVGLKAHLAELEKKYVSIVEDISLNYELMKREAGGLFSDAVGEECLILKNILHARC
ncbi:secernin-2 [Caerostris extrusa]|uniref:Secernin-2 n=1 Tax=Caerostris extrusa TaxID=172846 RepID=A0AAV4NA81_CAEEX|nr:secernin-2 [Caerostris extrusa]